MSQKRSRSRTRLKSEDSKSKDAAIPKMDFLQDWIEEYDNTPREVIPDKPTITDNRTLIRDAPIYKPFKPNKIVKLKPSSIKVDPFPVTNVYEKPPGEPTSTVTAASQTPAKAVSESTHKSKPSQKGKSATDEVKGTSKTKGGTEKPNGKGPAKAKAGTEEPDNKGTSRTKAGTEKPNGKGPAKVKVGTDEPNSNSANKAKAGKDAPNGKGPAKVKVGTDEPNSKRTSKAKAGTEKPRSNGTSTTKSAKVEPKSKGTTKTKPEQEEPKRRGPSMAKAVYNEPKTPRKANSGADVPTSQYKPQKKKVIGGVTMTKAQLLRAEAVYNQQKTIQQSENAMLYGNQEQGDTNLPIVHTPESAKDKAARQAEVARRLSTPKIWPTEYKEKLVTKVPRLVLSARSNESIKVRTPRPTINKRALAPPTKLERTDTPRPDSTVQKFQGPRDAFIEKRVVPLAKLKEYLKSGQIRIIRRIKHPRIFDLRTFAQSPLEAIQEVDEEVELAEEAEAMEAAQAEAEAMKAAQAEREAMEAAQAEAEAMKAAQAETEAMEAAQKNESVPDKVSGVVSPSKPTPSVPMSEIFATFFPETSESLSAVAVAPKKQTKVPHESKPRKLVPKRKAKKCDDTLPIQSGPAPQPTTPLPTESSSASEIPCLPDNSLPPDKAHGGSTHPAAAETESSRGDAPTSGAEMPGFPDKDWILAKARAKAASYSYDKHARVDKHKSSSVAEIPSSPPGPVQAPLSFLTKASALSTRVDKHPDVDRPICSPIAASPISVLSCSPDSGRPKSVFSAPPEAALESSTDCSTSKQLFLNAVKEISSSTQVGDDSSVEGKAPVPPAEHNTASMSSSVNAMRGRSLHVAVIPARLSNTETAVPVRPTTAKSPKTKHTSTRRNRTKHAQKIDIQKEDVTNNSEHVSHQMEAVSGQVRVDVMAPQPPSQAKSDNTRPSHRHKKKEQSQESSQERPTTAMPTPKAQMKTALKAPDASRSSTRPNRGVHCDPYTGERESGPVSNQLMKPNAPQYGAVAQSYEAKQQVQHPTKPYYEHKPKRQPPQMYEPKPPDEHNYPKSPSKKYDSNSSGAPYDPKQSAKPCGPLYDPKRPAKPCGALYDPKQPVQPCRSYYDPKQSAKPCDALYDPKPPAKPCGALYDPIPHAQPLVALYDPKPSAKPSGALYDPKPHAQPLVAFYDPKPSAKPSGVLYDPKPSAKPYGALYDPKPPAKPCGSYYDPKPTAKPSGALYDPKPSAKPCGSYYDPKPSAKPSGALYDTKPSAKPCDSYYDSKPSAKPSGALYDPKPSAKPCGSYYDPKPSAKPSGALYDPKPSAKPCGALYGPKPSAKPCDSYYDPKPSAKPSGALYDPKPSAKPCDSYYDPKPSGKACGALYDPKPSAKPSGSYYDPKPLVKPSGALYDPKPPVQPCGTLYDPKPSAKPSGSYYDPTPPAQPCDPKPDKPSRRPQTSRYKTAASSTPPAHLAFSFKSSQPVEELETNNSARNQLPHIDKVYAYTRPTK